MGTDKTGIIFKRTNELPFELGAQNDKFPAFPQQLENICQRIDAERCVQFGSLSEKI
jgi:hypothetical protein